MKCFVNLAENQKSFIGLAQAKISLVEGIAHLRTKTYLLFSFILWHVAQLKLDYLQDSFQVLFVLQIL